MRLTSLQFGFCVSLCVHAVLFGAITLGGLGRHKAQLPDGQREHTITLTLVAAPDEPVAELPNQTAPVFAAVPAPVVRAETPEPVETKPVAPLPIEEPKPVAQSQPTPLAQPAVPTKNQSVVAPTPTAPTAIASSPSSPSRVRGDGSSPRPGEDATTLQAPLGIRARPDYRKNPEPTYPLAARRRRQEGIVLLSVTVSSQGRAVRVELKQSSGVSVLDEAAIQAVRAWEFEPARVNSTPVDSEIEVPVRFKLQA